MSEKINRFIDTPFGRHGWTIDQTTKHCASQVIIRTKDPNAFYQKLNDIVLDEALRIETIQCADDNLQSVFGYLVHRDADTRTKGMQWLQNP